MSEKSVSYKDFIQAQTASPGVIHTLLLACDLKNYCDAAYPPGRQDGLTGEVVYSFIMKKIAAARRSTEIPATEPDNEITVGRVLTIARYITGHDTFLTNTHDELVYLLLVKPYADHPDTRSKEQLEKLRRDPSDKSNYWKELLGDDV